MEELFKKSNRTVEFIRTYKGENVDFHELMRGYGSTVDTPTLDFYKEIHQAYPQAKLILTVRDNGEKWFESFRNTIGKVETNIFIITVFLFYVFYVYNAYSVINLWHHGDITMVKLHHQLMTSIIIAC
jgi:hypothetical protein